MAYILYSKLTGHYAPLEYMELSRLKVFGFPIPFTCSPLVSLKPILHHLAQSWVLFHAVCIPLIRAHLTCHLLDLAGPSRRALSQFALYNNYVVIARAPWYAVSFSGWGSAFLYLSNLSIMTSAWKLYNNGFFY